MTKIFSPKSPPPPATPEAPPPVPTIDDARAAQQSEDAINRRRGRAATVLTGQNGDTTAPRLGASTALGY